jgi:hypothetical protein
MDVGWGLCVLGTREVAVEFAVRGFWDSQVRDHQPCSELELRLAWCVVVWAVWAVCGRVAAFMDCTVHCVPL